MTTLTVHSFKGGTGKSLVAAALAYSFSKQGKTVLLIDGDYAAPCLDSYFLPKEKANPFTTFLQAERSLEQTISKTRFPNLHVSYAPSPSFSEEILKADTSTHGLYLKRLLEGVELAHEKLQYDKIIFDNSSGITLPAINQLTCSNQSIIVIRPVRYGIESTYELIQTIYKKLRYLNSSSPRQDYLVWNQVPILSDSSYDPKIQRYLAYWTKKFAEAKLVHGTTIPYISEVISAMIVDTAFDLPLIIQLIDPYIKELKEKIEEE